MHFSALVTVPCTPVPCWLQCFPVSAEVLEGLQESHQAVAGTGCFSVSAFLLLSYGRNAAPLMRSDLQVGEVGGKEGNQERKNYVKFAANEKLSQSFLPSRKACGSLVTHLGEGTNVSPWHRLQLMNVHLLGEEWLRVSATPSPPSPPAPAPTPFFYLFYGEQREFTLTKTDFWLK